MVVNADPLETFPGKAVQHTVDKEIARISVKQMKRQSVERQSDIKNPLEHLVHEIHGFRHFRPHSVEQISELAKFARRNSLSISVLNPRGTGTHGDALSGDIIIELCTEQFDSIVVDRDAMTVTVGGAVTSRSVDTALSEQGLITPLVGYTVGLGAFLSGGFGFSSRLHGLTVDNILDVEIVLADGSIVHANAENNSDLFWGLRGSGTCFGLVTSLTLKCYPLVRSLSANIIFPFEQNTAADLLKHWRDCVVDAPNELYSNFVIAAGPQAPTGTVVIIQICHLGPHETGMPIIQKVASFAAVKYMFKDCDDISYLRQQELVESVLKGAVVQKTDTPESQVKYLLDGNALKSLTDEVATESCRLFQEEAPAGSIWCFELFGGSVADHVDSCIPLTHRRCKFHAASIMRVPLDDPSQWVNDTAGRDWIRDVVGKVSPGGPLPSFLPTYRNDEREAKHYHDIIRGSYGHANWSRLKKLKKLYDPYNCFDSGFDSGMLGHEEALIDGV